MNGSKELAKIINEFQTNKIVRTYGYDPSGLRSVLQSALPRVKAIAITSYGFSAKLRAEDPHRCIAGRGRGKATAGFIASNNGDRRFISFYLKVLVRIVEGYERRETMCGGNPIRRLQRTQRRQIKG